MNEKTQALVDRLLAIHRRGIELFGEGMLADDLRNAQSAPDRVCERWVEEARGDARIGLDVLAIRDAAAALTALARDLADAKAKLARWEGDGGLLEAVQKLSDFGPEWPDHGNAPLAIAASYALLARDLAAARQALADLTAEPICLLRDYEAMRQLRDEARTLHQELILQVGSKFPNETRHETAKRYIREREDLGRLSPFGSASATREGQ